MVTEDRLEKLDRPKQLFPAFERSEDAKSPGVDQ
jgi:hypothetical protein